MAYSRPIMNTKSFVCLLLLAIVPLNSDPSRDSKMKSLSMLYEELSMFPKIPSNSLQKLKETTRFILPMNDENDCQLVKIDELSSVGYYGVRCNGLIREGLISFSTDSKSKKIPPGQFQIIGRERIGTKDYIRISLNKSSLSNVHLSRTIKAKRNEYKQISNPNLAYFKAIAYDSNRRKESPSNIEIFFDPSCPLKFREVDQSFYWDNTISYVFEISCVKNTPYSVIKVPGNKQHQLVASNRGTTEIKIGDRFLAKIRLTKITDEQAYWDEFKIYYE